jgi:hypothetical protein
VKAPTVKHPLDDSKFVADPCATLNQSQLQYFGVSGEGRRSEDSNGVGCLWSFGATGKTSVGVSFVPQVKTGLSNTYQLNAAGVYKNGYFDPIEVDGYPAVYNFVGDLRPQGSCDLDVGISDQAFFGVHVLGQPGTDGCKAALSVAKAALQTIQGGQ